MRLILLIFLTIAVSTHHQCHSQDSTLFYSATLQGSLSTGQIPFWLQANQNGIIPKNGSFAGGHFGIYRVYNPGNPRFIQWSAGAQLIANTGKSGNVFFNDLYAAVKFGPVEIMAGQKASVTGLMDTTLTSGSISMSGNSRTFPRIQISTPQFFNIIPGNNIISFKFSYSDGLLGPAKVEYGNVSSVPAIYMHQKSLYLRLSPIKRLSLYAGFNHQAMWGGEEKIFSGGLKKPEAYKYVVFGKSWLNSRVGNHFGTIDMAAEWKGKKWNTFLYRQSIYEDGSLVNLSNVADGLNGLRFKRVNMDPNDYSLRLNAVLVEYVYTKNQGGPIFDYDAGIFGSDNYYNHYVYRQGWSYRGRSLGTPLIGPQDLNRADLPVNATQFTINNRITAVHLGLDGSWNRVHFFFKSTFSKNAGTYGQPQNPALNQTSMILFAEKPISSIRKIGLLSISLAADFGQLYPNNTAITVGWRKSGFIN